MLDNKKILMGLTLSCVMGTATHADVLVILPETGSLARAGLSIQQGLLSAYQAGDAKNNIKFMNSDQQSMKQIWQDHVNKKTTLVIGPLARKDVEAVIQLKPKIPVLALNEVSTSHPNVWQYSLSKQADAKALLQVLKKDQLNELLVFRQPNNEAEYEALLMSLMSLSDIPIRTIQELPKKINERTGVLLLGHYKWINSLKKLPTTYLYGQPMAIEQDQPIPLGMKFCDVPALYEGKWADVSKAYQRQPTTMPYQRLLAFGGDAWQIAEHYVAAPKVRSIHFNGRTGIIDISANRVERQPTCYEKLKQGIRPLA